MKKLLALLVMSVLVNACVVFAQEKNVFTHKVENTEVCLLSEGQREGNTDILIGVTPEMIQKAIPEGSFISATNLFLVRSSGKNVLIDTGFGRNLFDNLQSCGVSAEQIDAVLITHAHGDHIGGLLRDGKASFPNATLYLSQAEHEFWTSDEMMNRTGENRRAGFQALQEVVEVYKDRLHLFIPNEIDAEAKMLFPDIQGIAAYGHTPGHTLFMVGSGEHKLLIWGDLTHAMPVQMRYPHLAVTYDTDPEQAVASRLKILEYISKNSISIAGMHIVYPAIGEVKESPEGGYVFTPVGE
jgi:glyoxylase-like metal-dependent hydrolase (beta-lactamase superfamily II)